jgi:serine protease DegQ
MDIRFAIPINLAKQLMHSIATNCGLTLGWLGVEPQNLNPDLLELLRKISNT